MGGIRTGVGLFSGIDSASLIDQLINAQRGPQVAAQRRIIQLKSQQAAFLDINSRLNAFKTAAASFRVNDVFSSRSIASSDETSLTATATSAAVPGNYNFIVDRLVSTQQLLSRGFADQDTSTIGLDSLTFESPAARLDTDNALADLNDGDGIQRGTITVNGTDIDLTRVGTVQEVLDAISTVAGVSARVENDKFVILGLATISQTSGAGVLESLGLDGTIALNAAGDEDNVLTGTSVYSINGNTTLQSLNDGRGISTRTTSGDNVYDFTISVDIAGDGSDIQAIGVRIGDIEGLLYDDEGDPVLDDEGVHTRGVTDGAVSSLTGVIDRINNALADHTTPPLPEITASINTATGGISITDSSGRNFDIASTATNTSTAEDLGIAGSYTGGTANGSRLLAGLNTRLISSLNGGTGLGATDGILNIQTQDGLAALNIDVSGLNDINDIINRINDQGGTKLIASVNSNGTGIQIEDTTTGVATFSISGTGGADTAAILGVSGSFATGTTTGSNLQLAYIGEATLLSALNDGQGIGTGKFEIRDSEGNIKEINITSNDKTLGDVIKAINSAGDDIFIARINDNGDGILIEKGPASTGAILLEITNKTGTVATKLGIEGIAVDDANNFIDGSLETVIDFEPDATLEDIRNAINSSGAGANASIINTGIGTSPFRLSISSERSGIDGRFLINSGGFDLGINTLDEGNDSRTFFGSTDPAQAVLLTSSTNQLDGIVQGVTIDLLTSSEDPIELTVTTDTTAIEAKVAEFVAAFNSVVEGIDFTTRYDQETEERGVLLGDGTLQSLRNSLFSKLNRSNDGFTSAFDSLSEVGITIGSGSELKLDTAKFREAYAEDPTAVENLFSRQTRESNDDGDPNTIDEPTFSELSVLGQLEEFANVYVTNVGGVLKGRSASIDTQIKLQEDRIESIQKSLENKRLILERQFLRMEQAIGSFQSQGSALSQLSALG